MKIQRFALTGFLFASIPLLSAIAPAASLGDLVAAVDFDQESHPEDDFNVRTMGNKIGYINNGNWIKFENFDFAGGTPAIVARSSSPSGGESITVRIGSPTGAVIGTIVVGATGDWNNFQSFTGSIDPGIVGIHDVYLVFSGGQDLQSFRFDDPAELPSGDLDTVFAAVDFDQESHPGDDFSIRKMGNKIGYINNGNWIKFEDFDFAGGTPAIVARSSSPWGDQSITVRLDSPTGAVIGTIAVGATGDWNNFQSFTGSINPAIMGVRDVYLVFSGGQDLESVRFDNPAKQPSGDLNIIFAADGFNEESHPGDDGNVRDQNPTDPQDNSIGYLNPGNWVKYAAFDFNTGGLSSLAVQAATPYSSKGISVRLDNPGGEEIAWIEITDTGGWWNYQSFFTTRVSANARGVRDLFLVFEDGGLNLNGFVFGRPNSDIGRPINAVDYDAESHPTDDFNVRNMGNKIGYLNNGNWVAYHDVNFGGGAASVSLRGASPVGGGQVEFRLGSPSGEIIGSVGIGNTGGWDNFQDFKAPIVPGVSGIRDLYLVLSGGFDIQSLTFQREPGGLHVYPPVPGLTSSPRYSFRVREAGSPVWKTPFAFFTKCQDYEAKSPTDSEHKTAYFAKHVGSWSHTYCNFEMAENTPIEVEITRLDGTPITTAVAKPAHKVTGCSVVNGKVLVTLENPSLFAVEINGQLDNSNAPRGFIGASGESSGEDRPYRTPQTAIHTVSVFANPFILDKPVANAPGVHMVNPGQRPNPGPNDTVIYFKPGVHNIVPAGAATETFTATSPIQLQSGMSYYIPGDALIHGNFVDGGYGSPGTKNVRIYGHGTVSGTRIPHWNDYTQPQKDIPGHAINGLQVSWSSNSRFEGITLADQAHHGVYLWDNGLGRPANFARWLKLLSWRVNNDGIVASGNGYIEDCFIRHQDDGSYVRGMGISRTVFWSDVNGCPLRGELINSVFDQNTPAWALSKRMIVEDIDILYARHVFSLGDAIINAPDGKNSLLGYDSANNPVYNTGQYAIFRNIRVHDPRPQRNFMRFNNVSKQNTAPTPNPTSGLFFQNIMIAKPHVAAAYRNTLLGTANAPISSFTFENAFIDGNPLGINDFDINEHVSGIVFE